MKLRRAPVLDAGVVEEQLRLRKERLEAVGNLEFLGDLFGVGRPATAPQVQRGAAVLERLHQGDSGRNGDALGADRADERVVDVDVDRENPSRHEGILIGS